MSTVVSKSHAIEELERELLIRKRTYPRLVLNGELHRATAARQFRRLEAAIYYLKYHDAPKENEQSTLNLDRN